MDSWSVLGRPRNFTFRSVRERENTLIIGSPLPIDKDEGRCRWNLETRSNPYIIYLGYLYVLFMCFNKFQKVCLKFYNKSIHLYINQYTRYTFHRVHCNSMNVYIFCMYNVYFLLQYTFNIYIPLLDVQLQCIHFTKLQKYIS